VALDVLGGEDMPLKSKAQGRLLNARFGHAWVEKHHFGGSQKGLPQHVGKKRKKRKGE
jgi:hypothetical protein